MKTIAIVTKSEVWDKAQKTGEYTQSTITSTLEDVGYIHCTSPDQTMTIIQRFADMDDLLLLLIEVDKVKAPVKFEPAPSGRPGLFPHIYGPLNTDAVYAVAKLEKDEQNQFTAPKILTNAIV